MGRAPCCDKNGLKKGPWTPEEDEKLVNYVKKHGQGTWRTLPKKAGLSRCGKSCRLRWNNYLKPDIKRGLITEEEEVIILELHSILGNKWSKIAAHLPGRTDNEIKNHWNTKMRRKLLKVGIDPQTHKPVVPDVNQILHYSQLMAALNPAGSLMNIWTNILLSQVDPTQLVKLQLLQKLVKTIPGPNNNNNNNNNNVVPSSESGSAQLGIADFFLALLKSSDNNSGATSNVNEQTCVAPPIPNVSVNSLGSTSSSSGRTENSIATLITDDQIATPKSTSSINGDQTNNIIPSDGQVPLSATTTTSSVAFDIFQNWEELLENEAFWKDFTE